MGREKWKREGKSGRGKGKVEEVRKRGRWKGKRGREKGKGRRDDLHLHKKKQYLTNNSIGNALKKILGGTLKLILGHQNAPLYY